MATGDFSALDRMIASLRSLSTLPKDAAAAGAPLVEAELRATAAAGQAPDGTPWAPRKKDGGRAMANAANAITVRAVGTTILITLRGPEVYHHFGAAGKPPRRVIPMGSMPKRIGDAVRLGFVQPWRKVKGQR